MNYKKAWSFAVFEAGEDGYSSFRIPSVLTLPNGWILAFAEGRRNSISDSGEIDIVEKISRDGGKTFGTLKVAVSGKGNTAGNPCPVYDVNTKRVVLVFNRNDGNGSEKMILRGLARRTVHVIESEDMGESWGEERNITDQTKKQMWTWQATGPCHAVQLASGRLVIPCNHAELNPHTGKSGAYISHTLYSDDHGESWHIGADIAENTNECTIAACSDGTLLMNMRSFTNQGCRALAISRDNGETFSDFHMESALPEPCCQGSMLTIMRNGREVILFSNPASPTERIRMTIHESMDNGKTWSEGCIVTEAPSAYSDLTELDEHHIAILYETGKSGLPYDKIEWTVLCTEA